MSVRLKIVETDDGSHSLVNLDLNEGYHSFRGALGESQHVFIEAGLKYFLERKPKESVNIFEVGFGTGLNAWLTYEYAKSHIDLKFHFESVETFPVGEDIYTALNYTDDTVFLQMHECSWNQEHIFGNFHLTKWHKSLAEQKYDKPKFDIIYFDAFAPSKQPELWEKELLQQCYNMLNPQGILVTYCAQGQFKRNLEALGFVVETLPGALGKKEMVRATRKDFVVAS